MKNINTITGTLTRKPRYAKNNDGSRSILFVVKPDGQDEDMKFAMYVPKAFGIRKIIAICNKWTALEKGTAVTVGYSSKTVVTCGDSGMAVENTYYNAASVKAVKETTKAVTAAQPA
ncbi:MAG: hypothetical protein HDQ88_02365 [Clostridia bacterium]|nr:hypothetical protein [Clostridia bacterium]